MSTISINQQNSSYHSPLQMSEITTGIRKTLLNTIVQSDFKNSNFKIPEKTQVIFTINSQIVRCNENTHIVTIKKNQPSIYKKQVEIHEKIIKNPQNSTRKFSANSEYSKRENVTEHSSDSLNVSKMYTRNSDSESDNEAYEESLSKMHNLAMTLRKTMTERNLRRYRTRSLMFTLRFTGLHFNSQTMDYENDEIKETIGRKHAKSDTNQKTFVSDFERNLEKLALGKIE